MIVLQQALTKLWEGGALTGDDRIALFLLLTMLASSTHLLTMLATRWGDRNIAVKSLLASLMVHAVCLLSLEVFDPLEAAAAAPRDVVIPLQEVQTEILMESDDAFAAAQSGNSPLPEMMTDPEVALERTEQPSRLLDPLQTPEPDMESLDPLRPDVEDLSQFEQSLQPELAVPVDEGMEGPRAEAASDPAADVETMLEQSKADVYVPGTERVNTVRGDIFDQAETVERQMTPGSVDRIDPRVVTEDTSVAVTQSNLPDTLAVPDAVDAEDVNRTSAPVNAADPLETTGADIERPQRRSLPSRSFDSRLPRPSRSLRSPDPGERPVRQNSSLPRTPIPLSDDYDQVRTGATYLKLSDALRSAATMVDADRNSARRRETSPATYRLRDAQVRRQAAARFGGTRESEAAVELSLRWLNAMQSPEGYWDAARHGAGQVKTDENGTFRDYAGRDADTGVTALVTLSFLGAGYTHETGKYAMTVDNALAWLIAQQGEDGNLAGGARRYARNYCHAMATYALAEALGMQKDIVTAPLVSPDTLAAGQMFSQAASGALMRQSGLLPFVPVAVTDGLAYYRAERLAYSLRKVDDIALRSAVLNAVRYSISQQDPESGGWRYEFGQEGDVSMFGWQLMSLKSARIAGLDINATVNRRMVRFINSVRQGDAGGLFGYRRSVPINGQPSEPVTPVMTAEALFCQQMLGYPRDTPANRESVAYLLQNTPKLSELNMYYWYYGTLAMYQYGGQPWDDWNRIVRDTLVREQRTSGPLAGSWDPKGPWGRYGGRLYSTALSTLTLEVYYRLLPLYRMNEPSNNAGNATGINP